MEQIFTKDELYIINEFKNLKLNCIQINESLQSSIQQIIDIYLKPSSFLINFKNGFRRDHPLTEYSLNVLIQFEIGYNYWKNLQSTNFDSIFTFCNKFNEIDTCLNNITSPTTSTTTTTSTSEKDLLFSTINKQFNEKVEKFDNSIISIQLSIPQLFQFLSNLHSNSSEILLNKPIKYTNPIDGKYKQSGDSNGLVSSVFTHFQKPDSTELQQQQQLQLKNNEEKKSIQSQQLIESNENKSMLSKLFSKVSNSLSALAPPNINQLLDDHPTHQKLWNSKIWIKKKIYTHSVSSELVQTFTFKQPCSLFFWVKFWMSVPPTYQNQTIKNSSFILYDMKSDQLLFDSSVIDKDTLQPYYLITGDQPKTTSFKIKYKIEADLYKSEITSISEAEALELQLKNSTVPNSSPKDTTIINYESISEKEKKFYKKPTSKMNHDTPAFKAFIEKNELYRKQIPITESSSSNLTKTESILSFAYRVSIFLKINVKYISPPPIPMADALSTVKVGGGDCACLSHLAAAILRYNNIPARILYGIITTKLFTQTERRHVKLEFYNEDIGLWFPYDPSDVSKTDPYYKKYFATDPDGTFLTHHIDPLLDIPVLGTNETRESVFQTCSFKYLYPNAVLPQFDSMTHDFTLKTE